MNARVPVYTLLACTVALAVYAASKPCTANSRQAYNLQLADEHVLKLEPLLKADARYKQVKLGRYTGQGGAVWVMGDVADPEAALALRHLVDTTAPPVAVKYTLRILSQLEADTP
ncbi:MAG: hypothetical protein WD768_13540 [Phycisphaeraceae bacterium]